MNKNYCSIYLVRHGETDWNLKGLIQGHIDIPLNFTGERQAGELAGKIRHVQFAAIFSSDLLREIAVAYAGKNVLVVSHGGPMSVFLGRVLGYILPHGIVNNTSFVKIDCDGVDFFIRESCGIELPGKV